MTAPRGLGTSRFAITTLLVGVVGGLLLASRAVAAEPPAPLAPLAPLAAASPVAQAAATDPAGPRDVAAHARLTAWQIEPRTAAAFAALCPGCGHFYLDRPGRGVAYLGSTVALFAGGITLLSLDEPAGGDTRSAATKPIGFQLLMAGQNLHFYNIFSAYRDARVARGDDDARFPITRETLPALVSAPFRPSVLRRPWIWAGVPLAVGAALGVSALISPDALGDGTRSLGEVDDVRFLGRSYSPGIGFALAEAYHAALFVPVGLGEEALFRGVLQAELAEHLGPWGGWATASLIFGALHTLAFTGPDSSLADAAIAVPFITAVGSGLGLAYMKTGYRLETSVAAHFWYDFLLTTASFVVDPEHQPFALRLGLQF
ncbi:MAG: CPBP family intramembrane metalloprotease [Myxococcales bacterium]|nr:CPBP family intramembrane metalloprotease [Myxococcales bacterium]